MKLPSITTLLLSGALISVSAAIPATSASASALEVFEPEQIRDLMRKVNDYTLDHPYKENDRDWIRATWYSGVMEAYRATGEESYLKQALAWGEKHQYQIGEHHSGFNRMFPTMIWLDLYQLDPDPKKIAPTVEALSVADKPWSPVLGKVWYGHNPHHSDINRAYADALYAAGAFVQLYQVTGEQKYLDWVHEAYWTITDKILDKEEDLYYRDSGYIGKKTSNGRKLLWSRGNGWVFAGLPRILQHLPKDDPYYDRYVELYRRLAESLASRQGDDGFWHSNLDDPWDYRMPESSGTAFFVAGYAWGIRQGFLDTESYLPVIIRGWKALTESLHPSGLMGWIQPVDGKPRPSHPMTTQEYGAGLFMYAGAEVYLLVKAGTITPEKIQAALPAESRMLPPAALEAMPLTEREHPLHEQIDSFMTNQKTARITPTGLTKEDYLEVIAGQIEAMRAYQDAEGRIVDPVAKVEKYFVTACYAHSVAALAEADYPIDAATVESGMQALDVSLADLVKGEVTHDDFFTWPIVLAYELFEGIAPQERRAAWKEQLMRVDPTNYKHYRKPLDPSDHKVFYKTYGPHFAGNWNLVNTAGEWSRVKHGMRDPWYVEYCMTMQLPSFNSYGLFRESGSPFSYDLFARHYLTGMLARGYDSFLYTTYRDILWRGVWTSLFIQSPFGELPTQFRSSHHIWNEAQQAVVFEIYASAYAKAGRAAEAGAFKRAAHLSLRSIQDWIRPDGSGYIVKNRYPIEKRHAHEHYSAHTAYNMLATSMLAQAWQFADDRIAEQPAPADVGGFVVSLPSIFHSVFANAGGNYAQYNTNGDRKYNPTGLLRIHLKDGHPQLGPSDGRSARFGRKDVNLAVGPVWQVGSNWISLAGSRRPAEDITVLEETAERVRLRITYREVSQTITIDEQGVTVADEITLDKAKAARLTYPMLVFDGKDKVDIDLQGNHLTMGLHGKKVSLTVLEPEGLTLQRSGEEIKHVNGIVEKVYAETDEKRLVYRISAD